MGEANGGFVLLGFGVGLGLGVGIGVAESPVEGVGGNAMVALGVGCRCAGPTGAAGLAAAEGPPVAKLLGSRKGQLGTCCGMEVGNDGALPGATCVTASRTTPPTTNTSAATMNIKRLMRDQRRPDAS